MSTWHPIRSRFQCCECVAQDARKCKAFLDKKDKAKAEWRLKGDLAAFEDSISAAIKLQ